MKKKLTRGLTLFLVFTMLLGQICAAAAPLERGDRGEWVAEFGSAEAARAAAEKNGGDYLGGGMTLLAGSETELAALPGVRSLTPNSTLSACAALDDEGFENQWYLTDGIFGRDYTYTDPFHYFDLHLEGAKEIRVAVVDTGVDATHPDLVNRVAAGYDVIEERAIAAGTDSDISYDGHGTAVAGLIAAEGNNGIGTVGTAYLCPVEIVPVRALDASADGSVADLIKALYWCADEGEVDVINLSFGKRLSIFPTALQKAVDYANGKGAIIVAAAGNDGETYAYADYDFYPAALRGVLAVGAIARELVGGKAAYAEFTNRLDKTSLRAFAGKTFFNVPGEELYTTKRGGGYDYVSGTSGSAALFSGMIAGLLSLNGSGRYVDPLGCIQQSNDSQPAVYHYYGATSRIYDRLATIDNPIVWPVWEPMDPGMLTVSGAEASVSGVLMRPELNCDAISLSVGYTYDGRTTLAEIKPENVPVQPITFTFDSTGTEYQYYSYWVDTVNYEDGTRYATNLYQGELIIDNEGSTIPLHAFRGGEPMGGAKITIGDADGNETLEGRLSIENTYRLSAALAEKGAVALIRDQDYVILRSLEKHPAGGEYTLGHDPSELRVDASGVLGELSGAALTLSYGGLCADLGTLAGEESAFLVDTDLPLVIRAQKDGLVLQKTVDLTEGDAVWSLSDALSDAKTLNVAVSGEGASGCVLRAGSALIPLASAGGSARLSPGEYDLSVVVLSDGGCFSVDFGRSALTESRSLTVGASLVPSLSCGETAVLYEAFPILVTLRDSCGNRVADLGSWNESAGRIDSDLESVSLDFQSYNESTELWEDEWFYPARSDEPEGILFSFVPSADAGKMRVRAAKYGFFEGDYTTFTVLPDETRPYASVYPELTMEGGGSGSEAAFMALLKDTSGNDIVRRAVLDEREYRYVLHLPIGEKYSIAAVGLGYDDSYEYYTLMTVGEVDLTGANAGDTVDAVLTVAADAPVTELVQPSGESAEYDLYSLGFYPFPELPDEALSASAQNPIRSGLSGSTRLRVGLAPDRYALPVLVYALDLDARLADGGSVRTGLPVTLSAAVRGRAEGGSATVDFRLVDAAGNGISKAAFVGSMGGGGEMLSLMEDTASETRIVYGLTLFDAAETRLGDYESEEPTLTLSGLADGVYTAAPYFLAGEDTRVEGTPFRINMGGGELPPDDLQLAPASFTAAAESESSLILKWSAPAGGCAGYRLLRDGEEIASLPSDALSYTDGSLESGRYYLYTLYAVSEGGVLSAAVTAGARPSSTRDTQPPTKPEGLSASEKDGEKTLTWSRSSDDTAVTAYVVSCDGAELARVYNRRFALSGAAPGAHSFTVAALDGAGNRSSESDALSVTIGTGLSDVLFAAPVNKLGDLTGTDYALSCRASADVTAVRAELAVVTEPETAKSLTVELKKNGSGWSYAGALPADFVRVDSVTLHAFTGGSEPAVSREALARALRRSGTFTVTLTNSRAVTLPEEAEKVTVTLSGSGCSVSAAIENFSGVRNFSVPLGDDYTLTITGSGGTLLCSESAVSVTRESGFAKDAGDLSLYEASVRVNYEQVGWLQVKDRGAQMSAKDGSVIAVGRVGGGGLIDWSGKTRLIVPAEVTVTVGEDAKDFVLSGVRNELEFVVEAPATERRSVSAVVKDSAGAPVAGVPVTFVGNTRTTAYTGSDGTASATVEAVVGKTVAASVKRTRTDEGFFWNCPETKRFESSCELYLERLYDTFTVAPEFRVKTSGGALIALSESEYADCLPVVSVGETRLSALAGVYSSEALLLKDGEDVRLRYALMRGGKNVLFAEGGLTFDPSAPAAAPSVVFDESASVELTVSVKDTEGESLFGKGRRILVYDESGLAVQDIATANGSERLFLERDRTYTFCGSWLTDTNVPLDVWRSSGAADVREETAEAGKHVELSAPVLGLTEYVEAQGEEFEKLFFSENGFSACYYNSDPETGAVHYEMRYTAWGGKVCDAEGHIELPEGAYNVIGGDDPSSRTLTASYQRNDHSYYEIVGLAFDIALEDLIRDPIIRYTVAVKTPEGVRHYGEPQSYNLPQLWGSINGPGSIGLREAGENGYPLQINCPLARSGWTVTVSDGAELIYSGTVEDSLSTVNVNLMPTVGAHSLSAMFSDGRTTHESKAEVTVVEDSMPVVSYMRVDLNNHCGVESFRGGSWGSWLNPFITGFSDSICYNSSENKLYYTNSMDKSDSLNLTVELSNPDRVKAVHVVVIDSGGRERDLIITTPKSGWVYRDMVGNDHYGVFFQKSFTFGYKDPQPSIVDVYYDLKSPLDMAQYSSSTGDPETYAEAVYEHLEPADESKGLTLKAFDSEEEQAQALADWEKFKEITASGPFRTEEEARAAVSALFGDDGVWDLPAWTDESGEQYRLRYRLNTEEDEEVLDSLLAVTGVIDGEERKTAVLPEFTEDSVTMRFYGMGDLLMPKLDASESASLFDDGLNWQYTTDAAASLGKILKESVTVEAMNKGLAKFDAGLAVSTAETWFLNKYYPKGDDGFVRDERYNQVKTQFEEGWGAAKKAITNVGDVPGIHCVITSAALQAGETAANLMEYRIHQMDDVLRGMDLYKVVGADEAAAIELQNMLQAEAHALFDQYITRGFLSEALRNRYEALTGIKLPVYAKYYTGGQGVIRFGRLIDPSGVVFEAVEDERVSGVTASVRYWDAEKSAWVLWDSENYGQPSNPMQSLSDGYYGWDVTEGLWKVTYEKAGYYNAESEELAVPPAYTDVNISLVSAAPPAVADIAARADGRTIELTFDKYMRSDELRAEGVLQVLTGGIEADHTLETADEKTSAAGNHQAAGVSDTPAGLPLTRRLLLHLADPVPTGGMVTVRLSGEVSAYNGMSLGEDYEGQAVIPERDPDPVPGSVSFSSSEVTLQTGESLALGGLISWLGAEGTIERWESDETAIASVSAAGVVSAHAEGTAVISAVSGEQTARILVTVTREPVSAAPEGNLAFFTAPSAGIGTAVKLCSFASGRSITDPIEGDTVYFPASYEISENGTVTASGNVEAGAAVLKLGYVPRTPGTLSASVTFRRCRWNGSCFEPLSGETYTANTSISVSSEVKLTGAVSGDELTYSVSGAPADAILAAARYDGGMMTDYRLIESVEPSGTVTLNGSGEKIKLMLLDGETYMPLCADWSN